MWIHFIIIFHWKSRPSYLGRCQYRVRYVSEKKTDTDIGEFFYYYYMVNAYRWQKKNSAHSYDTHWQNLNRNNLNYSLLESCVSICADNVKSECRYEQASVHQCTSCILDRVSIAIAEKRIWKTPKFVSLMRFNYVYDCILWMLSTWGSFRYFDWFGSTLPGIFWASWSIKCFFWAKKILILEIPVGPTRNRLSWEDNLIPSYQNISKWQSARIQPHQLDWSDRQFRMFWQVWNKIMMGLGDDPTAIRCALKTIDKIKKLNRRWTVSNRLIRGFAAHFWSLQLQPKFLREDAKI